MKTQDENNMLLAYCSSLIDPSVLLRVDTEFIECVENFQITSRLRSKNK